ncbi:MAG TPA: chemotaxis protein CheA [Gemmatimonadaceae bacterium]|nr:chemotaxis protein CheA [Gemmatimonadaceae bacterium]
MDTSQYAELFLTESREHVSAMNHWLLELERGGAGDEPVSAIFRAVHTIKGMSATMGYAVVAELSHELEGLLDRMRKGRLHASPDVMDVLFRAADVLEGAIEASVAGRVEQVRAEPVLERLRLLGAATPRGSMAVIAPAEDAAWTVPAPEGPGQLVRVRLAKDTPLRGVRAFLVVQALRRLGEVAAVSPPLTALQGDEFDLDFAVRLVTPAAAAEIAQAARGAGEVAAVHVGDDTSASRPTVSVPAPSTTTARPSGMLLAADVARAEMAATGEHEAPSAGAARPAEGPSLRQARHVRIDLRRLDALMNLIGELVITRGRLQQLGAAIGDAALTETIAQASRLISDLRDEIMTSRMVPVWQVFDRFPRLVRDAARGLGKQIDFTIEGKDIELDRSMLDEIGDPIVHLLRNAVDHGIEPPEERLRAGKPAAGRLALAAYRDRSAVVIRVSDDGRGIDRQRVLARAKASGLVDASRTDLSDDELTRIIARPGFSTAERVTDLSGRGVGVDAVFTRVRALGGSVDIRSTPGHGTVVTLRLPLTLAILRALLARVSGELYAVPMTHVSETVELRPEVLRTIKGREVLTLRDDVLPLMRLRHIVGLPPRERAQREQVIILDLADRRAGLVVDGLAGQEEIVVKQFDAVHSGVQAFSGATILGDGAPALILDVGSLS